MKELWNSSPIGRLLEEISWEGKSVSAYRDGGRGRENVLTVEALMLLDFRPRKEFLGRIIGTAHGADSIRQRLVDEIKDAAVTLLPDETRLADETVVQPDASIETASVHTLVEAKRIRRSSFQASQLSREWDASTQTANGRDPLLLLILGSAPPVSVAGNGRISIADAIAIGRPHNAGLTSEEVDRHVAWITWDTIQTNIQDALDEREHSNINPTVDRLGEALIRAIEWHR